MWQKSVGSMGINEQGKDISLNRSKRSDGKKWWLCFSKRPKGKSMAQLKEHCAEELDKSLTTYFLPSYSTPPSKKKKKSILSVLWTTKYSSLPKLGLWSSEAVLLLRNLLTLKPGQCINQPPAFVKATSQGPVPSVLLWIGWRLKLINWFHALKSLQTAK